ncbi:hypothetical protein RDI58_024706 [Solanum bulbocastanum]|uniref:Uncharacterized protein n=1 Tax=Solanum bulbocastanum TaxID=147425 RepID=A0AAN8Y5W6_SOLBU
MSCLKVQHHLLNSKDIIPVEGFNLDDVVPGVYIIHCLLLTLVHLPGASSFSDHFKIAVILFMDKRIR